MKLHRHLPNEEMPVELMSDHALVWHCKALIADIMNMVATGQIAELPEHVKANIQEANTAALAMGFTSLTFDL